MSTAFPFLSLPGELRNKVYNYALRDPAGVYLVAHSHNYRRVARRIDPDAGRAEIGRLSESQHDRWRRHVARIAQGSPVDEIDEGQELPGMISLNQECVERYLLELVFKFLCRYMLVKS